MELKYQTKQQFMARLAAKAEDASGDEAIKYLTYIHKAQQAGDITDAEIVEAFAFNISTWDRIKGLVGFSPSQLSDLKSKAKKAADAKGVLESLK